MVDKFVCIVLIFIAVNVNVIHCVTCVFNVSRDAYECLLLDQNIQNDDDITIIEGTHGNGFTDANVTYLNAENSNITVFPSQIIDYFTNLTGVRLSGVNMQFFNRPITNCDSLSYIYLENNAITTLSGGIFRNCRNLRAFHMENSGVRFLDSAAFAGTNITDLYLQNNQIAFLQQTMFAHIPHLQVLFLSNNTIEDILPGTFDATQRLISIFLNRNKFTSWSRHNIPELYSLYLDNNKITAVSSDAFANMTNLRSLDLSNNAFTEIPSFRGLSRVSSLGLMFNRITNVQAASFTELTSLAYIYLSFNEIDNLNFTNTDETFLPNVAEMSFSRNQLTSIDQFVLPANVTRIDFSFNRLTHLKANSIQSISQLRYLIVDDNEIRKIDRDFFNDAVNLTVSLRNNHCYSDIFTISDSDDLEEMESMLETCYNHATNAISSVVVLMASIAISVILTF